MADFKIIIRYNWCNCWLLLCLGTSHRSQQWWRLTRITYSLVYYEKPNKTRSKSLRNVIATYSPIKITYKPILKSDTLDNNARIGNNSVNNRKNNDNKELENCCFKRMKTEIAINNICANYSMAIVRSENRMQRICKKYNKTCNSDLIPEKRMNLLKDLIWISVK
jgi:hypothetical protein